MAPDALTRRAVPVLGPLDLDALAMRDRLASGALRAREVAEAVIARVESCEPEVRAFAWFDEDHLRAEADRLDRLRRTGLPVGPLHGIPIGVKDVIDTRGIPTENGTAIDAGRVPAADAFVVRRLHAAGALVAAKTVTAELAYLQPGPTRNPADPSRTPGGSSQGSAAAVGAGMLPLALGTQTGGSVIRPASFCGVVGYKPTYGLIPRTGILAQSPSLDCVGVFSRSVEGAALLAEALIGDDPGDPATDPHARLHLLEIAASSPPVRPTLAVLHRGPGGLAPEPDMAEAMAEVEAALGESAFAIELPSLFDEALGARERINLAEMAKCYHAYERRGAELLSEPLMEALERGRAIPARDYLAALDWPRVLGAALDAIFDRCDAIITPAAPGPAPGPETTGSAVFNVLWSLCGVPAVTLPLLLSSDGLPMGVQVVGRRGDDARLLRTARWLWVRLSASEGDLSHA